MTEETTRQAEAIAKLTNIAMANRMAIQVILKGMGEIDLPVRDAILSQLRNEADEAEAAGVSVVADGLRELLRQT